MPWTEHSGPKWHKIQKKSLPEAPTSSCDVCDVIYVVNIKILSGQNYHLHSFIFLFIDFRERERKGRGKEGGREGERKKEERLRNINFLFHLFTHSLVASCMCSDWRSNPQFWCMGTTL